MNWASGPGGAGQPVRLPLGTGVLVLDEQIQRTIGVRPQRIAVAEGAAVEGVGDLEAVLVIHGDRPEGLHRGQFLLIEVEDVVVFAVQRLPLAVGNPLFEVVADVES
jgi:hypothetical protein